MSWDFNKKQTVDSKPEGRPREQTSRFLPLAAPENKADIHPCSWLSPTLPISASPAAQHLTWAPNHPVQALSTPGKECTSPFDGLGGNTLKRPEMILVPQDPRWG